MGAGVRLLAAAAVLGRRSMAVTLAGYPLFQCSVVVGLLTLPGALATVADGSPISYWNTSHSIALLVERTPEAPKRRLLGELRLGAIDNWDGDVFDILPEDGEPWWWLVATKAQGGGKEPNFPWAKLSDAFNLEMGADEKADAAHDLVQRAYFGGESNIDDPKLSTVRVEDGASLFFFRAYPKGACYHSLRPPTASGLPEPLPKIPFGYCAVELDGLESTTDYDVFVFSVADGASATGSAVPVTAKATYRTKEKLTAPEKFKAGMLIGSILAMCISLVWRLAELLLRRRAAARAQAAGGDDSVELYEQLNRKAEQENGEEEEEEAFDMQTDDTFQQTMMDITKSMTMFLPFVGPAGLVLASDVVIGKRLALIAKEYDLYKSERSGPRRRMALPLFELLRRTWNLVLNVGIVTVNIYNVQLIWIMYFKSWYSRMGLDWRLDASCTKAIGEQILWQMVSGMEIAGWVPACMLSVMLIATEIRNEKSSEYLYRRQARIEEIIRDPTKLPQGDRIFRSLSGVLHALDPDDVPILTHVVRGLIRFVVASIFAVLPHIWMWAHGNCTFFNRYFLYFSFLYIVNVAGVTLRFLQIATFVDLRYTASVAKMACFAAWSVQKDVQTSLALLTTTRHDAMIAADSAIANAENPIRAIDLIDPEDSKMWWHFREVLLIDIAHNRLLMQMLIAVSFCFLFSFGSVSLYLTAALNQTTSITAVTCVVALYSVWLSGNVLGNARDINLMAKAHANLLHVMVSEMNTPGKVVGVDDETLQHGRFLLQVALLIERQPLPESVAFFAVTPQLHSVVIGSWAAFMLVLGWSILKSFM